MAKRPFIRKIKRKRHGESFWDHEYKNGENLALSTDESEDLRKFLRWIERQKKVSLPTESKGMVLDLGCGNGRNSIYIAKHYEVAGIGYDSSHSAINEANKLAQDLLLKFSVRSIAETLPLEDGSVTLTLDMMSSHFLNNKERHQLWSEVHRVLVPGGWFLLKTFLLDGDLHTKRLLAERPAKEKNTYIHPVIGVPEHVYDEATLTKELEEHFIIHKIYRSHKHISKGKAHKRRTISLYLQKDPFK